MICSETFLQHEQFSRPSNAFFKLFLFCTLYVFIFMYIVFIFFFSMMSCHVVSLISKAFLLFRDTFDDRSVVTSYFLFVLAWLLPSSIHSWVYKATHYVAQLIKTYFEKKTLKEKLKLIIFPYCPELPKQKNLCFWLIDQLYIKRGVTLPLCKEYHFCSFEVSLKRSLYLWKQCCWIHIWSCLFLKLLICVIFMCQWKEIFEKMRENKKHIIRA